jgi:hypothetical protein
MSGNAGLRGEARPKTSRREFIAIAGEAIGASPGSSTKRQ